jgi:hypothetical protein
VHRVAQFVGHLTARVRPNEETLPRKVLPGAALDLFGGMPVADRRHGLDVAAHLVARGIDDPEVLAAALLHDVAKGRRLRLWHRVGGVLMERWSPGLLRRLASPDPRRWGYAWYLYLHHARLSARAALGAGCSERTAALIAGTADPDDLDAARALRAADEAS